MSAEHISSTARLAVALRGRGVSNAVSIDGLTGHLTLDAERRVHRDLNWAQIHDGEVRLLQPPSPAAAQVAPAGQ